MNIQITYLLSRDGKELGRQFIGRDWMIYAWQPPIDFKSGGFTIKKEEGPKGSVHGGEFVVPDTEYYRMYGKHKTTHTLDILEDFVKAHMMRTATHPLFTKKTSKENESKG